MTGAQNSQRNHRIPRAGARFVGARHMIERRKLLLYVSSSGASVAFMGHGGIKEVHFLSADVDGWEQLNTLLLAWPRAPAHIVIDSVEELYRGEILPRVQGADRHEMLDRRLRQVLHQTPYRAVLRQGRAESGQSGDRYLFMGFTAPEILRPWLDILRLRGIPLAGVWLAPLLSQALLSRFHLQDKQLLLVSEQTGGLRLSYFAAGRLRFSRLAPVESSQYDNPLEGYGDEIERTRQYLLSQRLLSREDKLSVYLLDPLNTLNELHGLLPNAAGFQCATINRGRILGGLRLSPSLLSESSDGLFLALLAAAPADANLLPREARRDYQLFRARQGVLLASTAWLGVALLVSLLFTLDAWRHNQEAERARLQAEEMIQQGTAAIRRQHDAQHFRQTLKALQAWRHVSQYVGDPGQAYTQVLTLAERHPNLALRELDWIGPQPGEGMQLLLEGDVTPFSGDYQAAAQAIRAFTATLQQNGWAVRVERWPMDPAAHLEQQGEFRAGHPGLQAPLRLHLRAQP